MGKPESKRGSGSHDATPLMKTERAFSSGGERSFRLPETSVRLALAQLNPTVGAFAGNVAKLDDALASLRGRSPELVAFPELFLTGYPPNSQVTVSCSDSVDGVFYSDTLTMNANGENDFFCFTRNPGFTVSDDRGNSTSA